MASYGRSWSYSATRPARSNAHLRLTTAVLTALVAACTQGAKDQRVTLVFPDHATVSVTTEVRWRLYAGGSDPTSCVSLRRDDRAPELTLRSDTRLPFPFDEDTLLSGELADGWYTIFVQLFRGPDQSPFLDGCTTVKIDAGRRYPVQIEVERVGACDGAACDAAPASADSDGSVEGAASAPDLVDDMALHADATAATPDVAPPDLDSARRCEAEWCDGKDNDCDGTADNGAVCPDTTVQHTDLFDGTVYFVGTTQEGACARDALQVIWPEPSSDYLSGFGCYATWYHFRSDNDVLYNYASVSGVQVAGAEGAVVPTPPCGNLVAPLFGFDEDGVLHYRCGDTLRRGNGEVVADGITELVAVLNDGRSVVLRDRTTAAGREDYAVVSRTGEELVRLAPHDRFSGWLEAEPEAATVGGNLAYVVFRRTYGQQQKELVVYRLGGDNGAQLVRRLTLSDFGKRHLALSDGTVLIREWDPSSPAEERIVAYSWDNSSRIIWREADASTVRAHADTQLLVRSPH